MNTMHSEVYIFNKELYYFYTQKIKKILFRKPIAGFNFCIKNFFSNIKKFICCMARVAHVISIVFQTDEIDYFIRLFPNNDISAFITYNLRRNLLHYIACNILNSTSANFYKVTLFMKSMSISPRL